MYHSRHCNQTWLLWECLWERFPGELWKSFSFLLPFRMRRFAYCKVVLATSLVWVMLDMFILLYFSECNKCDNIKERGLPGREGERGNDLGTRALTLFLLCVCLCVSMIDALTRPRDGPGEGGKPVVIPKENQEKMKEMFKINQFNLMASEMIALNRTLPDVRLEGWVAALFLPVLTSSARAEKGCSQLPTRTRGQVWTTGLTCDLLKFKWSVHKNTPGLVRSQQTFYSVEQHSSDTADEGGPEKTQLSAEMKRQQIHRWDGLRFWRVGIGRTFWKNGTK